MAVGPSNDAVGGDTDSSRTLLHSPDYLRLLLVAAMIGVPVSFAAFAFLAAVHEFEHAVWESLPHALGLDEAPAWWPIMTIGIAGVLVALAVRHLPGHGGHTPLEGLGADPTPAVELPGALLAAAASLVLGAVVGPEAPLVALGSGLALLSIRRTQIAADPVASAVVAAAGSAAAVSAIFGNPLVAAVIFLEVLGLARRQLMMVVLPCLLASGIGALLFTGLGDWTGIEIGALAIPELDTVRLTLGEVLWTVPLAALTATATWSIFALARRTAHLARTHLVTTTVGAGVLAGCSACAYAVLSGHPSAEVALSGQATLPELAGNPEAWSTGALVGLFACKAVAYALCLAVFRGGAVFPAVFLGAVSGVLASVVLPDISLLPGLAIGMAAGVAVLGLPVTGVVLVVLLLGDAAASQMPVVIVAVVVALVVGEVLSSRADRGPAAEPAH